MILAIGDFFIDKYSYVNINRVSPEHNGLIWDVVRQYTYPGGVGFLSNYSDKMGIGMVELHHPFNQITKHRIICNKTNKILARIDSDKITIETKQNICPRILGKSLDSIVFNVSGVICSDYNKGFFKDKVISDTILEWAKQRSIPVLVDTKKPIEFWKGFDFIKINSDEEKKQSIGNKKHMDAPTTLLITKGKYGAKINSQGIISFVENKNKIEARHIVGAGDVFDVEFMAKYTKTRDTLLSAQCAVKKATEFVCQPLETRF